MPGLGTQLTTLATQLTGLAGFPAPTAPLAPASSSLTDIQTSVTNIQTHVDSLLSTNLDPFLNAVRARLTHANAEIRYYYNSGLPLPLQSTSEPSTFRVSTFMSADMAAEKTARIAAALRSWMRVHWTGSAAQAAAMNTTINAVAITNGTQQMDATQFAMLSDDDPSTTPATPAVVNPMLAFSTHIKKAPP